MFANKSIAPTIEPFDYKFAAQQPKVPKQFFPNIYPSSSKGWSANYNCQTIKFPFKISETITWNNNKV